MPPKDYFKLVSTLGTIGEATSSKARMFSQFVDFAGKQPAEAVEHVFTKQLDAITYKLTGVTSFSDFKATPPVSTHDKLKEIYGAFITLNGVDEFMSDYTKSRKNVVAWNRLIKKAGIEGNAKAFTSKIVKNGTDFLNNNLELLTDGQVHWSTKIGNKIKFVGNSYGAISKIDSLSGRVNQAYKDKSFISFFLAFTALTAEGLSAAGPGPYKLLGELLGLTLTVTDLAGEQYAAIEQFLDNKDEKKNKFVRVNLVALTEEEAEPTSSTDTTPEESETAEPTGTEEFINPTIFDKVEISEEARKDGSFVYVASPMIDKLATSMLHGNPYIVLPSIDRTDIILSDKAKEYYGDKYSEALNKVKSQIGDGYYPSAYFKNIYTLVDNHETVISNGSSLKHDYNFPEKTFSLRTDIRNAQKGPFGSGVDLSITASHMNEAYELIPGAIQNQTDDLEIGPFSRLSDSELTEYNDIIPGVPISLTATTTLHVEINTNKGCSSGCAARPIIAKISDNTYLNLGHSESLSVPVVHLLGLEDQILNLENT